MQPSCRFAKIGLLSIAALASPSWLFSQEPEAAKPTARVVDAQNKVDAVPCLNFTTVGETHEIELGAVHLKSHTGFQFLIRNRTERTWNVKNLKVGCGCVVPDIALFGDNKQIDPGDGGLATIRGALNSGSEAKRVTVPMAIVDDDGTELAIISISADVQRRFRFDKSELSLVGPIRDELSKPQAVELIASATFSNEGLVADNFEVKSALPLEWRAEQVSPEQVRLKLEFSELSRQQLSALGDSVTVSYSERRQLYKNWIESLDIPIRFPNVFQVAPASIRLVDDGDVLSGEFVLAGHEKLDLQDSKIRCQVTMDHELGEVDVPVEVIRSSSRFSVMEIRLPKEHSVHLTREFTVSVSVDDFPAGELKLSFPD